MCTKKPLSDENLIAVRRDWSYLAAVAMAAWLTLSLTAGCRDESLRAESSQQESRPEIVSSPSTAPANDSKEKQAAPAAPPANTPRKLVVDAEKFAIDVQPFFRKHCITCHGPDKSEAELRLDLLPADFVNRASAERWVEVLDRLNLGEMPPENEPSPDAGALAIVTDWITSELQHARRSAQSSGGRALLRRLNRFEYANTVRDLLGVEFVEGESPLEMLPPDGSIAGFDKVSKALLIDPSLMDAYIRVAHVVANRAIVTRPPLVPERTMHFEFEQTSNSAMAYLLHNRSADLDGEFMVVRAGEARTYGKLLHPFSHSEIPTTGRYRIRVRAAADPGERGEPVYMDVTFSSQGRQALFRVDARRESPHVYEFEKTFDAGIPGEFQVNLVNGTRFQEGNGEWYERQNEVTRLGESGQLLESMRLKARMRAEGEYDFYVRSSYLPQVQHIERLPRLYLDWIELIGPLHGEYPPRSMEIVLGNRDIRLPENGDATAELADKVFTRLLPRAFRRPVKQHEVDALVSLVRAESMAGATSAEALRIGLVAMLCAPDFLFLLESNDETRAEAVSRPLDDYELATRLSYFLWSSMPDEQLLNMARQGRLHDPNVIAREATRMLRDPKSEGLVMGFAGQWLKTREVLRFKPDETIYPQFYSTDVAGLDRDIEAEPLAFFREVLRSDESMLNFLDSDWLMLNERLARFYGIEGVEGNEWRRVSLNSPARQAPRSARGGLLGMAAVHLWGADGNRTKPVERGKYVLDVLFNDPPAPPPPNAGEVEPNLRGERLTVRERLLRHRQQATCNHCHRRIDPFGLALENFNAIGQWRDRLDGERPLRDWGNDRPEIDVSGTLPNGQEFATFQEFRQLLNQQSDRFLTGLAEKMLVYALGRSLEISDRPTVDRVVRAMKAKNCSLNSLITAIVATDEFRSK